MNKLEVSRKYCFGFYDRTHRRLSEAALTLFLLFLASQAEVPIAEVEKDFVSSFEATLQSDARKDISEALASRADADKKKAEHLAASLTHGSKRKSFRPDLSRGKSCSKSNQRENSFGERVC